MTAEIETLQDRIAAVQKAKATLTGANTRLHLEFRTLTEELNSDSGKILKRNEKLAEKTKNFRLETARMKAEIVALEADLEDAAKTRWRSRMDSRNF